MMDGWKPRWQLLIAVTLTLAGGVLPVPLSLSAHAQTFPTGFVGSNEPAFGAVSPAIALNVDGTDHTVTFTCSASAALTAVTRAGPVAIVAGCYDITAAVQDFSIGSAASILNAQCGGVTLPASQVADSTVTCAGPLPAGNTMAVTINPDVNHTFGVFFGGYIPATCPVGTAIEATAGSSTFGYCVTTEGGAATGGAPTCPANVAGQIVTPVASAVGEPAAFCAFEVMAQKRYAEIRSITLTAMPSPCSGTFNFAQRLQAYFGPGCTVTASGVGTVVLKQTPCTPENLPLLIASGSISLPPDFPFGSMLICDNGLVAVTNIPLANAPLTFSVIGPGSLTTLTSVTGFCAGVAGHTSLAAGMGVAVTFCPTGPGTGTIQACVGGNPSSMRPPVCSNSIPFSYVSTVTYQAGQGTSTVSSTPPPGKFAKVCPKYPSKYSVCQASAPAPTPRSRAPILSPLPDVCPSGCRFSRIADAAAAAASGSTIRLGLGRYAGGVVIDRNVSLVGAGIGSTVIAGGGPVISITPGATVQMSGITITGGTSTATEYTPSGSGVVNRGTLALSDSSISGNAATFGGGLANLGTAARLTLVRTTVSGNSAIFQGGGIDNEGMLTLIGSTISGNTTTDGNGNVGHAGGGGIFNAGTLTVTSSAVSGNTTTSIGGGIANWTNGTVTVTNSTINNNSAENCLVFGPVNGSC